MLHHALQQANTVAIGGHIRPDGDCVGSCVGLYQYIRVRYPDKDVDLYLEEIPNSFHMFDTVKAIRHEAIEGKEYDLFISLDCADKARLGFSERIYDQAKHTFCIDHHISNPYFAESNYIVADASSTSELVYRLLDKEFITKEVAELVFLGIVHDTGVFQYASTTPETMEAVADLMRRDICASEIIEKTYFEKTYAQNRVLGRALIDSKLMMDNQCVVSYITKETMDEYQANLKDLEGIVSQLRVTKGVKVAVFLYEQAPGEFKISLRANDNVDVSIIAQHFGGGGHVKAAGFSLKGDPEEIIQRLSEQIAKQL